MGTISGARVLRVCYNCNIRFDAQLCTNNRGCYVVCPMCGKKIRVNSTSHPHQWKIGTIQRLK